MDFKFKACKKIAELTQVINILFVQNHEKDLMLHEFKNLVRQNEIEKTSRNEIVDRNKPVINEQDRQLIIEELSKRFFIEESQIRNHYELAMNNFRAQLAKSLSDHSKLEKEVEHLRFQYDELAVEKVRCELILREKLDCAMRETRDLIEKYGICEQNYQNVLKLKASKESETKIKIEKLNNDNTKMNKEINQIKERNNCLENKCKELEMSVVSLNDDLMKHRRDLQRNANSIILPQKPFQKESAVNEELKKELMRYKLEIRNRDKNFTKLFTKDSLKITTPFPNNQDQHRFSSENKNGFNACIRHSQMNDKNVALKIVSAQYDTRNSLPNLYREE